MNIAGKPWTKEFFNYLMLLVAGALFGLLLCFIGDAIHSRYSEGKGVGNAVEEPVSADRILCGARELSKDPSRRQEYLQLVNSAMALFKDDAKKDPNGMNFFTEDILDSVMQKQPGFAVRLEEYASQEARAEMERLRKEINADRFFQQQQEIAGLKAARHCDQGKIASISAELENAKGWNSYKGRAVPVILDNVKLPEDIVFVVKTKNYEFYTTHFVPAGRYAKPSLAPGEYLVKYLKIAQSSADSPLTVTAKPSAMKHGEFVNGFAGALY